MSVLSRITRGIGYGAVSLSVLGYAPEAAQVIQPVIPEVTVPAGMTFTPIRVGQVQVTPKILKVSYGKIVASGETGSEAGTGYALPAEKIQVRCGVARTEAGAVVRVCGRVVQVTKGKAVGTAGGKAVASSSQISVSSGEAVGTGGGWVRMQSVALRTSGGPGYAVGVRNLTDIEVIMMYRQMRRARMVAPRQKV